MTDAPSRNRRPWQLFGVPTLIITALVIVFLRLENSYESTSDLGSASAGTVVATGAFLFLYWLLTVTTWAFLVGTATQVNLPFSAALAQIVTVNLGKYVPGKVWGILARGSLMNRYGLSSGEVMHTSILEQFYLLSSAGMVAGIGVGLSRSGMWRLAIVLGVLVVSLATALLPRLLVGVGEQVLKRVRPSVSAPPPPTLAHGASLTLRYFAVWCLLGLGFAGVAHAITGIELSAANIGLLIFANTVGYVGGFLALFAPGGLGVRESIGAGILSGEVGLEGAALVLVSFRIVVMAAELIATVFAAPRLIEILRE